MKFFEQYKLILEAIRSKNEPQISTNVPWSESYTLQTKNYMITVKKTEPDYYYEDCNYRMQATNLKTNREKIYYGESAYIMALIIGSKYTKGKKTK